jgi:hypothetical protein
MFFTEKYLPTRIAMLVISGHAAQSRNINFGDMRGEEWRKFVLNEFWSFTETLPVAEIMNPDGNVMFGDPILLQSVSKESDNGRFFSPWIGVLGTFCMRRPETLKEWALEILSQKHILVPVGHYIKTKYARSELGQFSGMTIVFNKEIIKDFLSPKPEDITEKDITTEREACASIVQAFDRGEVFSKDEARMRFGGSLSARGFLRAWARAAEERPDLSRPGRRNNKSF